MITLHYTDELGRVEAKFDSIEEFNNYKEALLKKASDKKREEEKLQQEKEREEAARVEANWNTLKCDAKTFVHKAKSYGVTPSGVLELIKTAIFDAADDRCLANPENTEKEPKIIDIESLFNTPIADAEPEAPRCCDRTLY